MGPALPGIRLCPPQGCDRSDGSPFHLQGPFGRAHADHLRPPPQDAQFRGERGGREVQGGYFLEKPGEVCCVYSYVRMSDTFRDPSSYAPVASRASVRTRGRKPDFPAEEER